MKSTLCHWEAGLGPLPPPQLIFGKWPDSSMLLAGAVLFIVLPSGIDLLWDGMVVIIIISTTSHGGCPCHQVLVLDLAIHHKQISCSLQHLGFGRGPRLRPLLPLLHLDLGTPGVNL